jgi:hypothetical protein
VTLLQQKLDVANAVLSNPRLELFNRGIFDGGASETRLAWFIEATKIDLREYIWIDAESGDVLLHFSQLADSKIVTVWDAEDPADGVYGDLPGTLARHSWDGVLHGPTGDADVDAAYDFSEDTYDYFWSEHGRDSHTGTGTWMISSVHYCPEADPAPPSGDCPFANAFWNGTQTVFGEGISLADDIVAHEWTHGVTENTANLFYYMQSGALNESYSDIFGEVVDLTNEVGNDSAAVRWQLGEDTGATASTLWPVPLRDMMDPTAHGDPGKMSDPEFNCFSPGRDRGGVHTNSGVPNHAFALMVDGGAYNGIDILWGVGLSTAAKIQYRALAYYLTSASNFIDNYNALKQSCQDLSGESGFPFLGCLMVTRALDAVEMGEGWPCTSPTSAAAAPQLCTGTQSPDIYYYWDIETSGVTACPSDDVPAGPSWCLNSSSSLLGTFATSGEKSYWGYNFSTTSDFALTVNVFEPGTVPSGARMQFNHSHGFDNSGSTFYDGGQVLLAEQGTEAWVDAGPLITAGQPYGGTVSSSGSNAMGGQSAFVADSWGFTASQLNLSSYAGKELKYRFRVGTDASLWDFGWFIDDIRIYTCALCRISRTLDNAYNGVDDTYRARDSIQAGDGYKVGGMEEVLLSAPIVSVTNDFEVHGELTIDDAACIYIPSL